MRPLLLALVLFPALALGQSPSAVNGNGVSRVPLSAPAYTGTAGYLVLTKVAAPAAGTFDTCTGTLTASTTYYYRVSAYNAVGETTAFTEASKATSTTGATRGIKVVWTHAGTGVTGFKIYGRTTGAEQLIATVGSGTRFYCDSGALSPSGALPTANTTGTSVIDGPLTVNGALTATSTSNASYTATAGSGANNFVVGTAGGYVCLNGSACTARIRYSGTTMYMEAPASSSFNWQVNGSNWLNLDATAAVQLYGDLLTLTGVTNSNNGVGFIWRATGVTVASMDTSGNLNLVAGATKSKGTAVLSGGTGTVTVNSGAVCVCSNKTSLLACQASVTTTTLTVTSGVGTDTVDYLCL